MGLFDECVKYQDPLRRRRVVERPVDAILVPDAKFGYPRRHDWHRLGTRHGKFLSHLEPEKTPTQQKPRLFRKAANCIPCLRMEDNRPHNTNVSNVRRIRREILHDARAGNGTLPNRCSLGGWNPSTVLPNRQNHFSGIPPRALRFRKSAQKRDRGLPGVEVDAHAAA